MNGIRIGTSIHGRGDVVKEYPKLKPARKMCAGCRNDFYNGNPLSPNGNCWSFEKARVVDKIGHSSIHVCNGPDTKMVKTLSCWHAVRK